MRGSYFSNNCDFFFFSNNFKAFYCFKQKLCFFFSSFTLTYTHKHTRTLSSVLKISWFKNGCREKIDFPLFRYYFSFYFLFLYVLFHVYIFLFFTNFQIFFVFVPLYFCLCNVDLKITTTTKYVCMYIVLLLCRK